MADPVIQSSLRLFIHRFVSRPAVMWSVVIALAVVCCSSLTRTMVDVLPEVLPTSDTDGQFGPCQFTTSTWIWNSEPSCVEGYFSREFLASLTSILIRVALPVANVCLWLMLEVMRGDRRIEITYRKVVISLNVLFYHLWMIYFVYLKWASTLPFLLQFLLASCIAPYTLHAIYQLEFMFADVKCLRDRDMRLNPLWLSILCIAFNVSMFGHFLTIVISYRDNCCHLLLLFFFELVHRGAAIKTFIPLLWYHLRFYNTREIDAHVIHLDNAIEEQSFSLKAEIATINDIRIASVRNGQDTPNNDDALVAALPPTNVSPGTMVYVTVVWVPHPLVVPSIMLPIVTTQDCIHFDAVDAKNSQPTQDCIYFDAVDAKNSQPTQDCIYFDAVDAKNSRLLPEIMSPVVTSLRTLPYQLPEDILYVADMKAEYVSPPYKEEAVVNTVATV